MHLFSSQSSARAFLVGQVVLRHATSASRERGRLGGSMGRQHRRAVAVVLMTLTSGAVAQARPPQLYALNARQVQAVSADGSTAVGVGNGPASQQEAFR